MTSPLQTLEGTLIVSCQAPDGSPLRDTDSIRRLAQSALLGGAGGIRANGPDDIRAIRAVCDRPIIGLHKVRRGERLIITPTIELAAGLVESGADVVAIESSFDVSPDPTALISAAKAELGCLVMADVSNFEDGLAAWEAGADIVATTLSGYTTYTAVDPEGPPDLPLVEQFAGRGITTIAEGRFRTPEDVRRAFEAGAHSVVVGGAITDPTAITRRFVASTPAGSVR